MKIDFSVPHMNFQTLGNVRQGVKQSMQAAKIAPDNMAKSDVRVNPFEDPAMNITHRTDYQRMVPVSQDVKDEITKLLKDDFTIRHGMSGDGKQADALANISLSRLKGVKSEDRAAFTYTVSTLYTNEARRVADFIKSKDPSWDFGQPVKKDILDEAFSSGKLDVKV